MPEINPLHFTNAAAWHAWLAENSERASEAWVVHFKAKSPRPGLRYPEALTEALEYGWIDGKMKSIDADTFMLRYSPRKPKSVWSKQNRDKVEQLISSGKMALPGLAAVEASKASGNWDKAYSDRTAEPLPDDLQAALRGEKAAAFNFERFPVSSRNMYIRWIAQAKTVKAWSSRISEVVRRAVANLKPGI